MDFFVGQMVINIINTRIVGFPFSTVVMAKVSMMPVVVLLFIMQVIEGSEEASPRVN